MSDPYTEIVAAAGESAEITRLAAEVAALRAAMHDLATCGQQYDATKARRLANAWAGAYGWAPSTAEAVATAITTKETS